MKTYQLQTRQFIRRPLAEVFPFFASPENLARITPPQLRFTIVSASPVKMASGALVEYRVHPLLFPMTWVSRIEEYNPPHSFVDVQVTGPYKYWRHTHRFSEADGGTWIEDSVEYALPFGPLGRLAHALFVRRQLAGIFKFREQTLASIFGR